jgi:hypothetical protein
VFSLPGDRNGSLGSDITGEASPLKQQLQRFRNSVQTFDRIAPDLSQLVWVKHYRSRLP